MKLYSATKTNMYVQQGTGHGCTRVYGHEVCMYQSMYWGIQK